MLSLTNYYDSLNRVSRRNIAFKSNSNIVMQHHEAYVPCQRLQKLQKSLRMNEHAFNSSSFISHKNYSLAFAALLYSITAINSQSFELGDIRL